MGFGGSASAMIAILKNNKRERKSAFEKMKNHPNSSMKSDSLVFEKKASKEHLKKIREQVRLENRRKLILNGIGLTVVAGVIIYLLIQLKF